MLEAPQKFVGARLRQAREAFGLSVESLGQMLGVSRQAIDQFERGKSPSAEHLLRLCSILNKPSNYFYRPMVANYADETIFFRKLKKAPIVEIKSGRALTEWIGEVTVLLHEEVDFPELKIPVVGPFSSNPLLISREEIETAANEVRRQWGLGEVPIVDLVGTMETNGIIVVRMNFHSHDVDGLSVWDSNIGRPIVVLNADKASAVRSRFDAAHELGHLLLHRSISKEDLRSYDKEIESQAHYFASCLLLPAATFTKGIFNASMLELQSLKQHWRVSIAAMIVRLEGLGILDKDSTRRAWANYNRRGWKTVEPFDKEWVPESPRLLKEAIEILVELGGYSSPQLLEVLFPDASFLSNATSLPADFFRPRLPLEVREALPNLKMG